MIKNQWYGILPSKAVKSNEITAVKRLNLDLVLFRNSTGEVCCVSDKCSHRGASLSLGQLKDDCVKYPFHGIEFDKNGKCTLIPANGIASEVDKSRYNIEHYLVKECNSIIYFWYGSIDKATDNLPFFEYEIDKDFVFSEIEDHWNAHYSRCIENKLDVVHVPFVHHNTIGRGNKTLVNGPKTIVENTTIKVSANNKLDHGQKPKSSDECVLKSTFLVFKFPNIWINHISKKVKALIYFAPIDNENTLLYIRFYCKVSSVKIINKFIAFWGKYANRIIEKQDKRVVVTQKPKASELKMKENLLAGDLPIIQYR